MSAWVSEVVRREQIRKAFVFSAAMSQYVLDIPDLAKIFDFVDVDSAKWQAYGQRHAWPMSWIYRREGERLLQFERKAVGASTAAIFVTPAEKDLFLRHAPEAAHKVVHAGNGVDAAFFSPDHDLPTPYGPDERPIVFTGAMDYWPNVDAGCWFADEVLPLVRAADPRARLHIVGMNPAPEIRKRARAGEIVVTGRVPDIRPYLRHAAVVVAPLRVARGIQNKVLEAMAMARPVVTTPDCARGLSARPEAEIEIARDAADFAARTVQLIDSPRAGALGRAARRRVLSDYTWEASLARIERLLSTDPGAASKPDAFADGRIGTDLRSAAR
jgi:sugar transferase (PEP-CTERM/EpsH1 system associated)